MTIGPGKYDDQLAMVMLLTGAPAGCLVLFNGDRGTGLSCKINVAPDAPREAAALGHEAIAMALRQCADQIEAAVPAILAQLENRRGTSVGRRQN